MRKLILLAIALIGFSIANAQTNVGGGIFANATWTKANSPYIITSDMALFPGYTLTIEPGVTVKVNDGLKFILRGKLVANGTINDSISFISNSSTPSKSIWKGFQVENDLGGRVEVSYFKGAHADFLFDITEESNGEVLKISNSFITDNKYAIWGADFGQCSYAIDNTLFYDNMTSFIYCQNATINNCIFKKGVEGIHSGGGNYKPIINNCEFSEFSTSTTRAGGVYTNCKFYNNVNGLKLWPNMELINCEIYNNVNGLVMYYSIAPTNFSFNNTCVYGNTSYEVQHLYNYNIDLSEVSWKETDSIVLTNKIIDAYDDINLGIVKFRSSNQCLLGVGINNIANSSKVTVYPNPFSIQTTLQSDKILSKASLSIYNSLGQVVRKLENISGQTLVVSRDELPNGVYLLLLKEGNEIYLSEKMLVY